MPALEEEDSTEPAEEIFTDPRKFQVCRNNKCDFFSWKEEKSTSETDYKMVEQNTAEAESTSKDETSNSIKSGACIRNGHKRVHEGDKLDKAFNNKLNLRGAPSKKPKMEKPKEFRMNHCNKHFIMQKHVTSQEEQNLWLQENSMSPIAAKDIDGGDANSNGHTESNGSLLPQGKLLKQRLLTVSSMAFTQIPSLVSNQSARTMLILLR